MKIPQDKSSYRKVSTPLLVIGVLVIIAFTGNYMWSSLVNGTTTKQKLHTATVSLAPLIDDVSAYGLLKPQKVTSLIATVQGTIRQIDARPGALVEKGDIIMQLVNPLLQRKHEEAELAVLEQRAEQEKLKIRLAQKRRTLANGAKMALSRYRLALAELAAKKQLVDKKIVSTLDFEKATLAVEQANLARQLADEELNAFKQTKTIELNLADIHLSKAQKKAHIASQNISNLTIRAEMKGVLIDLDEGVQTGQLVQAGKALGLVADPASLYAEVQVGASDAPRLTQGQSVKLSVKGTPIEGSVIRISPNVRENQVQVDVALTGALPQVARSYIEVSAKIVIDSFEKGLLAKRPSKVKNAHAMYSLYVKTPGVADFELSEVKIGALSNKHMQILQGVSQGDLILLSEPENFRKY